MLFIKQKFTSPLHNLKIDSFFDIAGEEIFSLLEPFQSFSFVSKTTYEKPDGDITHTKESETVDITCQTQEARKCVQIIINELVKNCLRHINDIFLTKDGQKCIYPL